MPVPLQIIVAVTIAVLVTVDLVRRARRARQPRPTAPPPAALVERLRSLVAAGKKIQAIKALREHAGMGLAEAKAYVERIPPAGPVPPPTPPPGLSPAALARANELIAAGRYVKAVALIREDTGWPLEQAKDATDRLRASGAP